MAFILLGSVVGLCGIGWCMEGESIAGKIIRGIFGGIFGIFIGFLIGCFLSLIGSGVLACCSIEKESRLVAETPIYSIIDNAETVGAFSLGCGNIKGDLRYYYIVKEDKGEIVKDISSSNSYINKTDGQAKCMIYEEVRPDGWNWIGFNISPNQYNILYVPENTIQYQYNIDLQ